MCQGDEKETAKMLKIEKDIPYGDYYQATWNGIINTILEFLTKILLAYIPEELQEVFD